MRNIRESSPTVINCTFIGNGIYATGGGMVNLSGSPTVTNCIFWGNAGREIYTDPDCTLTITYSDVQGGYTGTGNISADPLLRDTDGPDDVPGTKDDDLRLFPGSPCTNAGDNTAVTVSTDLDGNPRIIDGIVDMGAYEQLPVYNVTQHTSHMTIQLAIDDALGYDEIDVAPGTYNEAIDFLGKAITLRSAIGPQVTNIDAAGLNTSVVICRSGEDPDTVLEGFTITGGTGTNPGDGYMYGGGMYNVGSSPTVRDCVFTNNSATGDGGAMYNESASPDVADCQFVENSTERNGGALENSDNSSSTVTNCTFIGNSATNGGAMHSLQSNPTVTNSIFTGNTADDGGGMYHDSSSPTVINSIFTGNTADNGGGMYNDSSSPTVTNCTFSGNAAVYSGGGVYNAMSAHPDLTNCIVWGNAGGEIVNDVSSTATVTYSDVQGGYSGTGNIDDDPLFVDDDGPDDTFGTEDDDVHLQDGSPCIDAGDNTAVIVTADMDGYPRIMDGDADGTPTVDAGAYEYWPDCNGNSIPDMCDIECGALEGFCDVPGCGLSGDYNSNSIPDECECLEANAPTAPTGEAGYEKTRYISFVLGSPSLSTAMRVTLTSLPPEFAAYENTHMWVGKPIEICENSGQAFEVDPEDCGPAWIGGPPNTMHYANLQADKYCHDFGAVGLLHVTDCEIVPGATYTVQAIHCYCDTGDDAAYSDPLTIHTSSWGNICGAWDGDRWSTPDTSVDATVDVTADLDKFKNLQGAPIKPRGDIDPNVADCKVNISTDVTQILDAFKGQPYPFAGPGTCPP